PKPTWLEIRSIRSKPGIEAGQSDVVRDDDRTMPSEQCESLRMMFAVAEADDHAVVTASCPARHVEATYGLKVNALWNRCLILVREGVDVPAAGQLLEKARAGICNP